MSEENLTWKLTFNDKTIKMKMAIQSFNDLQDKTEKEFSMAFGDAQNGLQKGKCTMQYHDNEGDICDIYNDKTLLVAKKEAIESK
jgi:hypothetical protein